MYRGEPPRRGAGGCVNGLACPGAGLKAAGEQPQSNPGSSCRPETAFRMSPCPVSRWDGPLITSLGAVLAGVGCCCHWWFFNRGSCPCGSCRQRRGLPTHPLIEAGAPGPPRRRCSRSCFWGRRRSTRKVRGVKSVETGYAGGSADTARYAEVSRGIPPRAWPRASRIT